MCSCGDAFEYTQEIFNGDRESTTMLLETLIDRIDGIKTQLDDIKKSIDESDLYMVEESLDDINDSIKKGIALMQTTKTPSAEEE